MADRTRDTDRLPEGLGLWFQTEDGTLVKLDWDEEWTYGLPDEGLVDFDISERERRIAVALCQLALDRLQRVPVAASKHHGQEPSDD